MGSMSICSPSSKRSGGGFSLGEKLSELSDEEDLEEDFEDELDRSARGRASDRPDPLSAGAAEGPATASR